MKYQYYGNCVNLNGSKISDMVESSKEISYNTLTKNIKGGRKILNEMFGTIPHISKDWSVSFYSSKFDGKRCYFLKHSAIEYVFINAQ
jgi:hypothetical protein